MAGFLPLPQTLLLKIGLGAATLAAIVGITWFAARAHYVGQFQALKAEIAQQAADQQRANDQILIHNKYVEKTVYDEAQTQLAGSSATIDDLNRRLRYSVVVTRPTGTVCTGTSQSGVAANGPSAATGTGQPTGTPEPTASTLPTETLRDALQTGIDALNADLLWREWYKGTHQ